MPKYTVKNVYPGFFHAPFVPTLNCNKNRKMGPKTHNKTILCTMVIKTHKENLLQVAAKSLPIFNFCILGIQNPSMFQLRLRIINIRFINLAEDSTL